MPVHHLISRRSRLMGNTSLPTSHSPILYGSVGKGSAGSFSGLSSPPYALLLTDGTDEVEVTLSTAALSTIIEEINDQAGSLCGATESEGCLVLAGAGTMLRVLPAISLDDAAPLLGLPVHPDPTATARTGDLLSALPRPTTQANPQGTRFLVHGDERTTLALNRPLHALSEGLDTVDTLLRGLVPQVVFADVDVAVWESDGDLMRDGDDQIDQVRLARESDLVWVGGLTGESSMREIARWFQVQDGRGRPLLGWDPVRQELVPVRVAAVTRGPRTTGAPRPTFAEESAPTGALADTDGGPADGLNALGASAEKHASVEIDAVRNHCILVCASATFITSEVAAGDLVTISGSTRTVPYSHNGEWVVVEVLSETELMVSTAASSSAPMLNGSEVGSAAGDAVVHTDGRFSRDVWVTFDPPIPRTPSLGFRVVYAEPTSVADLGDMSEGARAWMEAGVPEEQWRTQRGLAAVLDGPTGVAGSGGTAPLEGPGLVLTKLHAATTTGAGTLVHSGTGTIQGWVLCADPADSFGTVDIGRTCLVTLTGLPANLPCRVLQVFDGAYLLLQPPTTHTWHTPGAQSAAYAVYTGRPTGDLQAAVSLVAPATDGSVAIPGVGLVYVREQTDGTATTATPAGQQAILHLERIRRSRAPGNILSLTYTATAGTSVITLAVDPETWGVLIPRGSSETGGEAADDVPTWCRILNGPDAGWYIVQTTSSTSRSITLRTTQGGTPTLAVSAGTWSCGFYRVQMGANLVTSGTYGTGTFTTTGYRFFKDLYEEGAADGSAVSMSWRGTGSALYIGANDPLFAAYTNGDGADGWAVDLSLYTPAKGLRANVRGAASGVDAKRRAQGALLQATSNVLDLEAHSAPSTVYSNSTTVWPGFALWAHQNGHDVAGVFTRSETRSPASAWGGHAPAGVLVVRDDYDNARMGAGAVEVHGSIYQRGYGNDVPYGGIYTDSGIGAGTWLHPQLPARVAPATRPYDATDSARDPLRTRLGAAGQVYPPTSASTSPTRTAYKPRYDLFPFPHGGVVEVTGDSDLGADTFADPTRYVGLTVYLETGTAVDGWYTITGVIPDETEGATFALEGTGSAWSFGGASLSVTAFRIHGRRWYLGRVDVADWVQIGTEATADRSAVPFITSQDALRTSGTVRPELPTDPAADDVALSGRQSGIELVPHAYGMGVGDLLSPADMPHLQVTPAAYADGWQTDAGEPVSPFPNVASLASAEVATRAQLADGTYLCVGPILTATSPGNLVTGEYLMQHVRTVEAGAVLGFSPDYGGCLILHRQYQSGHFVAGTSIVDLWRRGRVAPPTASFRWRAEVLVHRKTPFATDTTLVLELRTPAGDVVASSGNITHALLSSDGPTSFAYTFSASDLRYAPGDALDAAQRETGLHLVIQMTIETGTAYSVVTSPLRILRVLLEQRARVVEVGGDLLSQGAILAGDFRRLEPVRVPVPVSPMDARELCSQEYGRWYRQLGGAALDLMWEVEGKNTGMLYDGDEKVWYRPEPPRTFFLGPHAATVVGHPYLDPYFYLDSETDSQKRTMPGRTGFLLPLRLPHGSRASQIHLTLSILPAHTPIGDDLAPADEDVSNDWQIWYEIPLEDATESSVVWRSRSVWQAVEGVSVVLYRTHLLDRAVDRTVTDYTDPLPQAGYAEELLRVPVSFADYTAPAVGDDNGFTHETTVPVLIDLAMAGLTADQVTIDLRHFSYTLAIEFFIGARKVASSGTVYSTGANSGEQVSVEYRQIVNSLSATQYVKGSYAYRPGINPAYDPSGGWGADGGRTPWAPPVVKFRGGVVLVDTDRL